MTLLSYRVGHQVVQGVTTTPKAVCLLTSW